MADESHIDNVLRAHRRIGKTGADPDQDTFVVDCDASKQRMTWMKGLSPWITRRRNRWHWLTIRRRRMNIDEMFRLQGMDTSKFKVKTSPTETGKQIGNSMSVNVVERLLLKILQHTGHISNLQEDRWANLTQPANQGVVGDMMRTKYPSFQSIRRKSCHWVRP